MNYRIIENDHNLPDVLLHRDRTDDGQEVVQIKAIGFAEDTEDYFVTEEVIFDNAISAQRFIQDFTVMSASIWCKEMDIKYSSQD